jgi:catechol 2,3-dioxygenase-like lactoylglutathione lyase family enzyme
MTDLPRFHLAMPVDDLDAARRFYGGVLGLAHAEVGDFPPHRGISSHALVVRETPSPAVVNVSTVVKSATRGMRRSFCDLLLATVASSATHVELTTVGEALGQASTSRPSSPHMTWKAPSRSTRR